MKGTIGLEYIGANSWDLFRQLERIVGKSSEPIPPYGPCVLEIFREDAEISRKILYGRRDYSKANSKGSRGVYVWYTLQQDRVYWIRAPKSWRSVDCYFAALTSEGDIYRLSQTEAEEWLSEI